MNDKVLTAYSKSCLTRLLFAFGLSFLVFILVFGVSLLTSLLTTSDIISEDVAPLIMLGCFMALFMVILGGVIVWAVWVRQRRNQQLDQSFSPLWLQPKNYLLSGRQYVGNYRGRQINVYFHISGGRYLRTPVLEIYVKGNFRTRLGIGPKNALTRLGGTLVRQQPITINDPAYEDMLIYPLDETWSRNLLTHPQARNILLHLMDKDAPGVRALVYNPEAVCLTLRHFQIPLITPETAREWVDDLLTLAEIAEQEHPPTLVAEASKMEQNAINNRGAFTGIAIIVVASIVICLLGISAITFLLFLSSAP